MQDKTPIPVLLLMHPHPETLRVLASILWWNGYEVITTAGASGGRDLVATRRVDLLIAWIDYEDTFGEMLMADAWTIHNIPSIALVGSREAAEKIGKGSRDGLRATIWIPVAASLLVEDVNAALGGSDPAKQIHRGDLSRDGGICPDCSGRGSVCLLVTKVECRRCQGTGRHPLPLLQRPLREIESLSLSVRYKLSCAGARNLADALSLPDHAKTPSIKHHLEVTLSRFGFTNSTSQ